MTTLQAAPMLSTPLYDRVATASAAVVIARYSTSFGWATRLLDRPVREHIRNIYALVRIADEIVDTPLDTRPDERARAGALAGRRDLLDGLERETADALVTGYSTNLVAHAFARTARRCDIPLELVTPFFTSMRMDLDVTAHDADSLRTYIYGSAEVVGLMCLKAFIADRPESYAELAPGARHLGAAFQKVNFLRDLRDDVRLLGRTYFPGVGCDSLTDAQRDRILDDVDNDLAIAATAIPGLPPSSRRAVRAAHSVFRELSARLRATPAARIREERVRVPDPVKARLVAAAVLTGGRS